MDSGAASLPPYGSPEGPAYPSYDQDPHKVGMQTENVHSKSTVVVIQQDTPPIRDDLLWSIFNTIYMNVCCLGFVALTYSVKSRDRKLFGDRTAATLYGANARKLNIAATVLTIIAIVIYIIIIVSV
ncbi:dispanin subfamily A member 2b-like [Dendropsophus ebraccatus]|uniref:dispanin subfamily A member 2b-like n=1 Tax=Dendropsophus ebraccatus TaxID=150705 RepID=UPI003831878E